MEEATANVPELSVRQDLMLRDQYPDNDGPTRDWDHSVSGYTDDHGTRAVDSVSHTRSTEAVAGSSDISTYEVVPGPVITTSTKSGPALPCYLLKGQQKNKTFCAREDVLRRLDDILVNQATADSAIPSGPNIFAICGFGGIGKTQIAVEFAYSRMNKFDAIFWLHADNSAKLAKDFGDIAQALGLEQIYGDQVISKDLVLDWLSRAAGEHSSEQNLDKTHSPKWLLIFDNADDPTILRDYIPVTGNGSILVTSRDPLAKTQTHFRTTDGIDLDVLSTRDAASLLRTLIGNTIDIRDVELSQIISEKLSGLPLAIAQIAGTIQRRGLSLDEFLVLYENDSNRVDFYQAADGDVTSVTGTQNTIFAVWALEDLGANAACLLDLMAFMDPDQIPESIYTEFNDGSPNQTLHLNISSFLSNPLEYVNARTELSRSSLLRRNIQLKELSLHRLIQDAARARMNDDRKAQVFKSSISLLYSAWPFGTFDHSNARHPLCEQICPHIRPLQIQYQSSTTLQRYVKSNTQFARLLMDAGWYQVERGRALECLPLQELSQRLCEADMKDFETRQVLAEVYFCESEVGLLTSNSSMILGFAKKGLEVLESCHDQTWRTPLMCNNMSLGHSMIGEWDLAVMFANRAINGFLALNQDEHYPDFAIVSKGYALQLKGTEETLAEAADLLIQHQKYRRETFGEMDRGSFKTGLSMLLLGDVRASQGLWSESLRLHEKALQQYLFSLEPKHQRTAAVHVKLADHGLRLQNHEMARDHLGKALEIFNDRPVYTIEITRATFRLARVYSLLGDEKLAMETRQKAETRLKQIGEDRGRSLTEADVDGLVAFWSK